MEDQTRECYMKYDQEGKEGEVCVCVWGGKNLTKRESGGCEGSASVLQHLCRIH